MHPSNRYSSRYPNRSPEVGPYAISNPGSRLDPSHSTALDSTRLYSTRLEAARSLHLPFFTFDFNLNSVHHKNQAPYPRKATPLASS